MKQLLTATRMNCLLACPRKHYWRYEVGLRRDTDATALRFGSAWHDAMEARWQGQAYDDALATALKPDYQLDETLVATIAGLLAGYYARWASDPVKEVHPEVEFRQPLRGSRSFDCGGKIDGLGVMEDGRLALVEHKTTAADLSPDSDYWLRLRSNPQVMQYILAARALGWDVSIVLYDVTRKPSIRLRQYESPDAYADRLKQDTQDRPDFYFVRREVPILEDDLAEFEAQRRELARMILNFRTAVRRLAKPEQAWPRHLSELQCRSCDFASFCLQNIVPDPAQPPAGFRVGPQHPELNPVAASKEKYA
jgi:hypothetical protein